MWMWRMRCVPQVVKLKLLLCSKAVDQKGCDATSPGKSNGHGKAARLAYRVLPQHLTLEVSSNIGAT